MTESRNGTARDDGTARAQGAGTERTGAAFVGKDVAEALGYKDTSDALKRHVDEEDKLTRCFTDSGQNRQNAEYPRLDTPRGCVGSSGT